MSILIERMVAMCQTCRGAVFERIDDNGRYRWCIECGDGKGKVHGRCYRYDGTLTDFLLKEKPKDQRS